MSENEKPSPTPWDPFARLERDLKSWGEMPCSCVPYVLRRIEEERVQAVNEHEALVGVLADAVSTTEAFNRDKYELPGWVFAARTLLARIEKGAGR